MAQIQAIQAEYQKAVQPWLDRLARIDEVTPLPPMVMPLESLSPDVVKRLQDRGLLDVPVPFSNPVKPLSDQ
jgi:hypothetical protein